MLDVPRELIAQVSKLLAAERRARSTRKGARALTCWNQALFALAWFRDRCDLTRLGAGFGISRATAYRYRDEALGVLAAQAPDLREALDRVAAEGWSHVILDGKVVDADRCSAKTTSKKGKQIDLWYSGKTHDFGGNIQAVMRPDGFPIWVFDVEPGSVHDLTAAREHALGALYPTATGDLPVLADGGYEGAGQGVHTPVKRPGDGQEPDIDTQTRNMLLRSLRAPGERGFALLTQRWRAIQHVTACPTKIGPIAKATLVLTQIEHRYLSC
jgi:hypothetical protein